LKVWRPQMFPWHEKSSSSRRRRKEKRGARPSSGRKPCRPMQGGRQNINLHDPGVMHYKNTHSWRHASHLSLFHVSGLNFLTSSPTRPPQSGDLKTTSGRKWTCFLSAGILRKGWSKKQLLLQEFLVINWVILESENHCQLIYAAAAVPHWNFICYDGAKVSSSRWCSKIMGYWLFYAPLQVLITIHNLPSLSLWSRWWI